MTIHPAASASAALTAALLLLGAGPEPALAQSHGRILDSPLPSSRLLAEFSPEALPIDVPVPQQGATSGDLARRILISAAGAAIGAGVGYLFSQVIVGDWDPEDPVQNRDAWMMGGAAVGLVAGWKIGPPPRRPPPPGRVGTIEDRHMLSGDEVREAAIENAYDAIRMRRPEWLVTRGTASFRETPRASAGGVAPDSRLPDAPGEQPEWGTIQVQQEAIDRLPVYVDDVPVGDVEALRSVSAHDIEMIYFLDAGQATRAWGSGHPNGGILVRTR